MANKGLRKFKFERRVGRTVVNPLVAALAYRRLTGSGKRLNARTRTSSRRTTM